MATLHWRLIVALPIVQFLPYLILATPLRIERLSANPLPDQLEQGKDFQLFIR